MARFFKPQKRKVTDTKHKEITLSRLDHLGAGIGHLDRKPVFVDGGLPGEKVVVQLTEEKKQYARAKLIKCLTRSDARIAPQCPLYAECGGCNLQHLSHDGQIAAKQQSLSELMGKFAKAGQIEQVAPIVSQPWGYRRCARFSLMPMGKGLVMGFRKKQSKDIVNVEQCPVLAQSLNALLSPLREMLLLLQGKKHLGHVELVEADNGRVVLIRHLQAFSDQDMTVLKQFADQHQVMLYLAPTADTVESLTEDRPHYMLDGLTLSFSPKDFIQVNRAVNEQMVAQAIDWLAVTPQDRVLDLFCGLGNFSLPLAKQANALVGVEGIDEMVHRASENAANNQLHNAAFYQANLEDDVTAMPWAQEKFNKILLDPARAGAAGVMEHVVKLHPERVVYVSCNPATLARDSQVLLAHGYQLEKLGMMDMFPHTGHLESMALFVKP
ncbi:23S rRNA (uracil(1939)-C(5))-methyltransferase RlmD [Photobacterium aphoticum]|uniref:23S rRNA (uracil(1939)-C(5))-methyltransferase RlmD n=1 Tax=Photobacterium aphoticum TaxID=754436 RepID=A0A0J1GHB5_9GAMM|nr:23S rRNA (uracil(1939)-C(5))-methyltransferase RlmD [Photobacterium aphoticum]KLU98955.1 23S rRNA methyltransferase [Photobacterium aphoticum]PSU55175.1 23S rRNA (uracil(1939)-C(5))-methyltransferase RlmD [Photobacterium aphoticum]GHA57136.1 23S rRNA (uracil(1939)-C(5))-methyltransferase RlmD [Photobacterium aphoticum]